MIRNRRLHRKGHSSLAEANLTPLIDVLFVVLILFLIIAPMVNIDPIKLANSKAAKSEQFDEANCITVRIFNDQTVSVNKKHIAFENLTKALKDRRGAQDKQRLLVLCDKKAHFETYQGVKEAAESAGFAQMDIALNPKSSKR